MPRDADRPTLPSKLPGHDSTALSQVGNGAEGNRYYGYPTTDYPGPGSQSRSEIRQFGMMLRRRRWTILAVFVAAVASVTALSILLPKTYVSTTTVLVDQDRGGSQSSTLAMLEQLGVGKAVETEVQLVRSRRVVEQAIRERARQTTTAIPESEVEFQELILLTQQRLRASVVQRDGDLFELSCEGESPEDARSLCAAVAASYLQVRTRLERADATAAAGFLGEQVTLVQGRLADAERNLEEYRRRNRVIAIDERASEGTRQLIGINAQRDQLEAERAALQALIQQVEDQPEQYKLRDLASFPTFLQNAAVTQMLASLMELENERSNLAMLRSESSPDMAEMDSRIADIEGQLGRMALSYERALAAQIASLDATLQKYSRDLLVVPTQQVAVAQLQRQVSLLDGLYSYLETHRREAEVAKAVSLPSVSILDEPSLPSKPSFPNLPLNLALAIVVGLTAGMALALIQEHADTRFHEKHELESGTGLGVLSMIPTVRRPGPLIQVRARETNSGVLGGAGGNGSATAGTQLELGGSTRDHELAFEAFRSLEADLKFLGRELNNGIRSVAVTSAGPAEGKTFTACNLALARASHSANTLLVDADLRAGGVARFFGLPRDPGLHDVLSGEAEPGAVTRDLSVNGTGSLQVIPSGTPTSHSASFLEDPVFERLLETAKANVDMLIIDTPPLNILADAAAIASKVDAVLLVVRRGLTDRDALDLTIERLHRTGVPIVSVILNDVVLPRRYASYSRG